MDLNKPRIPMSVVFAHRTWVVTSKLDMGPEEDGNTDFQNGIITVRASLPRDYMQEVVAHELTHVIWEHFGLADQKVKEELGVTLVARGWTELLIRNPHLTEFLSHDDKIRITASD
jgi:hypothetical protein